ncbi:UvrD-helicase domain-containing protein [Polycladomyces zharkentensis]|nr:UvrD-helicase domain-containing protein [Polycladomyces sp. WAk]
MTDSFTPEQWEAINTLDVDCIVSAGAGSGKTRVLVERYLRILSTHSDDPDILDHIVAITFTEKAAAEMKERIRQGVAERLASARKNNTAEETWWYRLLSEMERARVMTIHAFCARLLREYPIEADVDPDFIVMDETEAAWCLANAAERAVSAVLQSTELSEEVKRAWETWVTGVGLTRAARELAALYRQMTGMGQGPGELAERTDRDLAKLEDRLAEEEREASLSLLSAGRALMAITGGKRVQAFQTEWPELEQRWLKAGSRMEKRDVLTRLESLLSGNWGRKEEILLPRNQMKQELRRLNEAVDGWLSLPEERRLTDAVLWAVSHLHEAYESAKQRQGGLDFDELQLRACKLLESHPHVRLEVSRRIRYLMVDEFQDTNELQKQLIDLLCREPDGRAIPGKRFVVGDPQQSIYRFRGADVSVFGKMKTELLSEGGKAVSMRDNFRSHPDVVAFVNALFSRLMPGHPDSGSVYEPATARGSADTQPPCVECLVIPEAEEGEHEDRHEREARWLARRICEMIEEGTRPGQIAVLFRAMTHVKYYERALAEAGIPFYVVKGRGFYDRQEVQDVLHFLKYLHDPDDVLSLVGVLRSPFCAVSDETLFLLAQAGAWSMPPAAWPDVGGLAEAERMKLSRFAELIERVRLRVGRVPVSELIRFLLDESDYRSVVWGTPSGKQINANLDKLIRLSGTRRDAAAYSLTSFLRMMDRLQEEPVPETEAQVEADDGDSVKLMTIHQAKGLEFPVVFVPNLSWRRTRPTPELLADAEAGLAVRLRTPHGDKRETYRWRRLREREERLEIEESVRLFYVAVTRAKQRLVLSGEPEEHKQAKKGESILSVDSWSQWLDGVLGWDNVDEETGKWTFPDGETWIRVRQVEAGEVAALPSVHAELDSVLLTSRTWFARENEEDGEPDDSAWALMEPRGVTEHDGLGISVTDLMTLFNCPRKYLYKRWINVPTEVETERNAAETDEEISPAPLPATLIGSVVHRVIECCPDDAVRADELVEVYRSAVAEYNGYRADVNALWDEVRPLLQTYLDSRFHLQPKREDLKEVPFVQRVAGLEVEGIIDRLIQHENGEWELVDYKTNRATDHGWEMLAREYKPQLRLYAWAAHRQWGVLPRQAVLVFLRTGREVTVEITPESIRKTEEQLQSAAEWLMDEDHLDRFEPRPGERCAACDFRKICPAAETEERIRFMEA